MTSRASRHPSIVWFRRDLRLSDHPALDAAVRRGGPVVPAFIWAPAEEAPWAPGAASRWWLHQSLAALDASLRARGSRLVLREGPSADALARLARETGADAVFWTAPVEPAAAARDDSVRASLDRAGIAAHASPPDLLFDPQALRSGSGRAYQVFTPWHRAALRLPPPAEPAPAPRRVPAPARWPEGRALASLKLLPMIDWAEGLRETWTPGEAGARARLRRAARETAATYASTRDTPAIEGTTRLSPHLHWGEASPRQAWHAVREAAGGRPSPAARELLRQIAWRDFAHHLLVHFPRTTDAPLRLAFRRFPWRRDPDALRAWQRGRTGYPVVDAGMRELWRTGWMHNRVRMIVASFLVKDLLLPWLEGARWFWDTLVDADLANNTLGWQWAGGCGADAAPYFRIFNPVSQGERFDPDGAYVRRWVPEIARLPSAWIHRPWEAPAETLEESGVVLGATYPRPVVDHAAARARALAALASLREARPGRP
jgi:deoxyribodipyrimidine photo-lyase